MPYNNPESSHDQELKHKYKVYKTLLQLLCPSYKAAEVGDYTYIQKMLFVRVATMAT